jgi:hypothetical protein
MFHPLFRTIQLLSLSMLERVKGEAVPLCSCFKVYNIVQTHTCVCVSTGAFCTRLPSNSFNVSWYSAEVQRPTPALLRIMEVLLNNSKGAMGITWMSSSVALPSMFANYDRNSKTSREKLALMQSLIYALQWTLDLPGSFWQIKYKRSRLSRISSTRCTRTYLCMVW